jgi:hypothetical protein
VNVTPVINKAFISLQEKIMANDRMFLLHEPTGCFTCIAKSNLYGWYTPTHIDERINGLFDYIMDHYPDTDQNAYTMVFEDSDESDKCQHNIYDYRR